MLTENDLHPSLSHPALNVVVFHTEVFSKYPDAISLAPGAPHLMFARDFDPARHLQRFRSHLTEDRGMSAAAADALLYEYGPSAGIINDLLSTALRQDLGLDMPQQAFVTTVGAQEAMVLLLRALTAGDHDSVAVSNPCFIGLRGAAAVLDVDLVPVPEHDDGIDLDRLAEVCEAGRRQGRRVRAVYLATDFSNPRGTSMSLEARHRLLDLAHEQDLLVIEDNTYGFTAAADARLPSLKVLDTRKSVITIGTFAKVCSPAARVGFILADQVVSDGDGRPLLLAQYLAKMKGAITLNTSAVSQAVVGGMLLEHGTSIAALGEDKAALYQRNLRTLLDALDQEIGPDAGRLGVSWNRPAGGFFVTMRLPVVADAALLQTCASTYQVLWSPMSQFYLDGAGDDEIRLSCSYLDEDGIREGVRRLGRFLRSLST